MNADNFNPGFRQKKSLFKLLVKYLERINILKKRNRELHQITETQNKIISILAHDVRNPLTSIKNIIELKKEEVLDPHEASAMMDKMTDQLNTTLEMVDNIVTWGQTQLNENELIYNNFNLFETAERVLLTEMLHSQEKNNILVNSIPNGTFVYINEQSVEFILRNLVSNANKFTANGTITVAFDRKEERPVLKVKDTGVGMTEEQISRLFKVDKTSSTAGTQNEKGSGMGLVLVHDLLERMSGTITIESAVRMGTTFIITL